MSRAELAEILAKRERRIEAQQALIRTRKAQGADTSASEHLLKLMIEARETLLLRARHVWLSEQPFSIHIKSAAA